MTCILWGAGSSFMHRDDRAEEEKALPCREQLVFNLVPTLRETDAQKRALLSVQGRPSTHFSHSFIHSLMHSLDQSFLSIYYVPAPVLDTGDVGVNKTKLLPTHTALILVTIILIGKCSVSIGFQLDTILNAKHGSHVILETTVGRYYVHPIL